MEYRVHHAQAGPHNWDNFLEACQNRNFRQMHGLHPIQNQRNDTLCSNNELAADLLL